MRVFEQLRGSEEGPALAGRSRNSKVEVGGGRVGEVVERLRGGGEHSYYQSPAMGVSEPKKDVLMVGSGCRLPTAHSLILSDTLKFSPASA
jgi:hypothetical protein